MRARGIHSGCSALHLCAIVRRREGAGATACERRLSQQFDRGHDRMLDEGGVSSWLTPRRDTLYHTHMQVRLAADELWPMGAASRDCLTLQEPSYRRSRGTRSSCSVCGGRGRRPASASLLHAAPFGEQPLCKGLCARRCHPRSHTGPNLPTGSESRLRFIASWTRMDTDPTASPLHENTMLAEEQRLIHQESPFA